jgi:hypothetical protein
MKGTTMSTPIPPPTFSWSTAWQALKIFIIVVAFLAAQQGLQAFTITFDSTKLMAIGELLRVLSAAAMGVAFGAIQGTLRAVQILLVVWAGPTLWGYLGPILATAAAMANDAAAAAVRVFRGIFYKREPTNT